MAQTTRTIDHDEIQEWAIARGGRPAVVEGTFDELGGGVLRIDFGDPEEALEELTWRDFFRIFETNDLAFVYEMQGDNGADSYVCKFVSRIETDDEDADTADDDVSDAF